MIDGMAEARVSFHIGERFKCFQELEKEVKRFEVATSTQFWIRDSRARAKARARARGLGLRARAKG